MRAAGLLLALALAGGFFASCEAEPPRDEQAAKFDMPRLGANLELLKEGDRLFAAHEYEQAKRAYAGAVRASGPSSGYVEASAQLARMELLLGTPLEGEPWLRMASARATPQDPLGWSRLQLVLGIYERDNEQHAAAVKRFSALYDYCLEYGLWDRAIDAARQIVLASEQPEERIEWSRKGIEAAEQGGMHGWLALLWSHLGASLEERGRYEDALLAYEEARQYHDEVGDEHTRLAAAWAVGHAQRLAGRTDEARATLDEVLGRARERYDERPDAQRAEWLGRSEWDLGELDLADGDFSGGRARLERARFLLKEAGFETREGSGKRLLAELDARLAQLGDGTP